MLEQKPRREARTSWSGAAQERKQSRMMWLTLVLLLIALGAEVARNSEVWFASDETTDAEDTTPVWVPNHALQTPAMPASPVASVTPAKKQVVTKVSARAAASGATRVAASRAVLPPLAIEVVAGANRHTPGTASNSLRIETLPGSELHAAAPKASQWGAATKAAERVRMSADQAQVQPQAEPVSYPLLGRQMKVEGAVLLQAFIGADGVIQELRVLSGPPILASAAREAALQWRFKPYLLDGKPVETQAKITVNFTIKVLDNGTRDQLTPVVASLNGQS